MRKSWKMKLGKRKATNKTLPIIIYLPLKCKESLLIKISKRQVFRFFLKITREDDFRRQYGGLFHNLGAQTVNDLSP